VATDLQEIADLSTWGKHVRMVTAAMVYAAEQIGQETADISSDYRRLRRALSVNVINDPGTWAPKFALLVAAQPAITTASTDGDIQFTVNAVWDAAAGAGPAPGP
jgi:hypothetical protein